MVFRSVIPHLLMTPFDRPLAEIGEELVKTAQESPSSSLPLSTELFPYLLIASRSMSLREISKWLAGSHGVELSAAAISRALRQPELHLQRLADHIAAKARYVALATNRTLGQLLYWERANGDITELESLEIALRNPTDEEEHNLLDQITALRQAWLAIPHEVRLLLRDYLPLQPDPEDQEIEETE